MSNLMRSVRAVLWASIGLGGRRADAEQRLAHVGVAPVLVVGTVLAALLIVGLMALSKWAAGA